MPGAHGVLPRAARLVLWVIAAFYAYGALVHVLNIASLTGFDWAQAPRKWQVLDVVYLVLDIGVALGLVLRGRAGTVCFFLAAFSQIALYTLGRAWILDVPPAFARSADDLRYLDGLVAFHLVTVMLMLWALFVLRRAGR